MLVSQCCGAPLDPMFTEPICNDCKEHCATYDDEPLHKPIKKKVKNAKKDTEKRK